MQPFVQVSREKPRDLAKSYLLKISTMSKARFSPGRNSKSGQKLLQNGEDGLQDTWTNLFEDWLEISSWKGFKVRIQEGKIFHKADLHPTSKVRTCLELKFPRKKHLPFYLPIIGQQMGGNISRKDEGKRSSRSGGGHLDAFAHVPAPEKGPYDL